MWRNFSRQRKFAGSPIIFIELKILKFYLKERNQNTQYKKYNSLINLFFGNLIEFLKITQFQIFYHILYGIGSKLSFFFFFSVDLDIIMSFPVFKCSYIFLKKFFWGKISLNSNQTQNPEILPKRKNQKLIKHICSWNLEETIDIF